MPWGITLASYAGDWIILLALRYYLQRENARRDRALAASGLEGAGNEKAVAHQEVFGYVEKVGPDGVVVRQKVEKALLDLTVSSSFSIPSRISLELMSLISLGPRKSCIPIRAIERFPLTIIPQALYSACFLTHCFRPFTLPISLACYRLFDGALFQ